MNKSVYKAFSLFFIFSGIFSIAQAMPTSDLNIADRENKQKVEETVCDASCEQRSRLTSEILSRAEKGVKIKKEEGVEAIRFSKWVKDENIRQIRTGMWMVQRAYQYRIENSYAEIMLKEMRSLIIDQNRLHNERVKLLRSVME